MALLSETLNWICSLNSHCNFVSHICSSACVTVFWPFRHHVSCYSFISFFPLLVFPRFVFLFFSMSFLLLAAVSSDLLYLKWLGCVVSAHLMELLQKWSCLPSQRNTILSIDHTTWQWWCQKLPPYTDRLPSMDGRCLRRQYFSPMTLSNVISIHISTACILLPETSCSILKLGSFMSWG